MNVRRTFAQSFIFVMIALFSFGIASQALAQESDYFEMSLEELLNVEIVSASKKAESIFDAPLSASVLIREEIQNSGVTSIPEALRLIPGMIVREQTAGNYDIHLRGFDNVPPKSLFFESSNSITLVMIDNRVVYNYYQGGTFWATLPIDLNDVEKIEVIRGPSSALYGPNAVAGVINIITRRPEKEGIYVVANSHAGNYDAKTGNLSFGFNHDDKFSLIVSANRQIRDRYQTDYYVFYNETYVSSPKDIIDSFTGQPIWNPNERYPDPSLGLDKSGVNTFMNYKLSDRANLEISSGLEESNSQMIFIDNLSTPFYTYASKTKYVDIKTKLYSVTGHVSILDGNQNAVGFSGGKFGLNTLDAEVEYDYHWKDLSLRPGVSYRKAKYDGELIGGFQDITTTALSLRSEYDLNKLRLIAAVRGDRYNYPDKDYLSFQFAATYKVNEKNLLRTTYSRANRAPFMLSTFLNFEESIPVVPGFSVIFQQLGNENLELLTMDMFEVGFRSYLRDNFQFDLEGFFGKTQDYDALIFGQITVTDSTATQINQYGNLGLLAKQIGSTGSISYILSDQFQIRAFGTVQQTTLEDFQPDPANNPDSLVNLNHKATPDFYGGIYINYRPMHKLNINLNSYSYTSQVFSHSSKETDIGEKVILNARISYSIWEKCSVYLNARNLLNTPTKEFAFADDIKGAYGIGVNFQW